MKTNAFHRPAFSFRLLGQFVRDCLDSLDSAALAVAQGRALNELRDRLVGLPGIQELTVDGSITGDQRSAQKEVVVRVIGSKQIATKASYFHINRAISDVNRRYKTRLRVQIAEQAHPGLGLQPPDHR
jgi:GMP synthase PP-ATPase subunit